MIYMIWGLLFIVGCSLLQLLWMVGTEIRDTVKSRAAPAVVVTVTIDVAAAEREVFRPLADMIAEAERKAIAMHSPLPGDPHQAQVVANSVKVTEVISLVGGGVIHVQAEATAGHAIEVTAIGDREPIYLYPGENIVRPAMKDTETRLRERRLELRQELEMLSDDPWAPWDHAQFDRALAEYEVIEKRLEAIARCRRNTTTGPGKPSPQSKRQTGHTPGRS
jgi:hypothetical protein